MENELNTFDNFEHALDILKNTVENLENGKIIKLDELIHNYERGMSAYNYCIEKLEMTKGKMSMIENAK